MRCSSLLIPQRFGEAVHDLTRPQILVFEIDQAPRARDDLVVGPGDAALAVGRERVSGVPVGVRAQELDLFRPDGDGIGKLVGQRSGRTVVATDSLADEVHRVARQRRGIVPPFPKGGFDIGDGRSAERELYVVPGRAVAVDLRHRLPLSVAPVICVVTPAVAQVDAPDERDVELGRPGCRRTTNF